MSFRSRPPNDILKTLNDFVWSYLHVLNDSALYDLILDRFKEPSPHSKFFFSFYSQSLRRLAGRRSDFISHNVFVSYNHHLQCTVTEIHVSHWFRRPNESCLQFSTGQWSRLGTTWKFHDSTRLDLTSSSYRLDSTYNFWNQFDFRSGLSFQKSYF